MGTCIVLLGHGTKDRQGAAEFLALAGAVREQTAVEVYPGVLEYPTAALPHVQTAFDLAVAAGAHDIVVLPALLHFAGHTRNDLPAQIDEAQARHPLASIRLAGPLGYDQRLLRIIEQRTEPFGQDGETALLLVGRGSLNTEANADLFKAARLLWDGNSYGQVEVAFVSLAAPDVPAGIDRCMRLGARRVVVVPYFVNTGILVKRIAQQAHHPGIDVVTAPHLGVDPLLLEVLLDRYQQACAGLCPCQALADCRIPGLGCERSSLCVVRP